MQVISSNIDLVDLIEQKSGFSMPKVANHWKDGPEHAGPCPFCQSGDDRFRVWPQAEKPHYWCRRCGKQGSPPWFLVEYCHLSYPQALAELGLEELQREKYTGAFRDDAPCEEWMNQAEVLVHISEKILWSERGKKALAYLHARGFTDETIRACHLGYIPAGKDGKWIKQPMEQWGLTPRNEAEQEKPHVTLFEGILIPWFVGERIWKLEVRKLSVKDDDQHKTPSIKGGKECLYNIGALQPGQTAVLVESALDAISGIQVCSDAAVFLATGSTTRTHDILWIGCLKQAKRVLVAFDNDQAGHEGAQFWCDALKPRVERAYPWSKDLNEMLQKSIDIRAWLENELESFELVRRGTISQPDQPAVSTPARPTDTLARENATSELEADFFADFPARPASNTYRTTSYAEMSAEAILDLVRRLQGAGVRMEVKDGCLEYDADFFLPVEVRRFFFNSQGLIIRWLQGQASQQSTCCRCGAPADHHSPGGHGYCTEHYLCVRGHAPDWVQTSSGTWVCRCVLEGMPQSVMQSAQPVQQLVTPDQDEQTEILSSATLEDAAPSLQGQEEALSPDDSSSEPMIDVHTLQPGVMPEAGQALLNRFLQEVPYEYLMWDVADSGIKADYVPRSRYIKNMTACLESGDQARCLSAFDALSHCIERYHRKQEHHQPGTLIQSRMDRLQASHMATSEEQAHFLSVGAQSGYPHVEISVCASLVEGSDAWHTFARTHEQSELQHVIDTLSAAGSGKEQRRIRNLVIPPRTYTTPVPQFEFVTDESGQRRLQQVGYWPEMGA